jgi:hypothetical protein
MTEREELGGPALQAWFDYEEECHKRGVSPDLSREELQETIENSTVEVTRQEHRGEIHAADWPRWGRMGGLRVLELYGSTYFRYLARLRWHRITARELVSIRERLYRARRTTA